MAYIKLNPDGSVVYPYTTLYSDNPNVSFPSPLTDDILAHFGVHAVVETGKPAAPWWQSVQEASPVAENGKWKQSWTVVEKSQAERDTAIAREWRLLRSNRNALLAGSDWTQLADSQADKAAWASYRQALRDLPQSGANPFEIVWPEEPR